MLYNPPSGSTDANAGYVGKNIAAGQQGSKIPPAAVEYTQREIVAAIAASGQSPTNGVLVQQAMALARGVFVGNLTGTGDLAVATLGVVFPSLLQGMRVAAVASAANTVTNPKLRIVNLGTSGLFTDFPILLEDGTAPAVGAIKAGRRYRYEADGAGNVLISGGGISSASGLPGSPGTYKTVFGLTTTQDYSALIIPIPTGFTDFKLTCRTKGITGTMSARISTDGGNTYLGEDGTNRYHTVFTASNYTSSNEYDLSFIQLGLDCNDAGSFSTCDARISPGSAGQRFQLLCTSYSPTSARGTGGSSYGSGVNTNGSYALPLGRATHLKLISTGLGSLGSGTPPGPIPAGSAYILEGLTAP